MLCVHCKQRYAEYPEEDFLLDLPVPPGQGIIPKSDEAHERRMCVFLSDEEGDCGCYLQSERYKEIEEGNE